MQHVPDTTSKHCPTSQGVLFFQARRMAFKYLQVRALNHKQDVTPRRGPRGPGEVADLVQDGAPQVMFVGLLTT